MPQAEQVPDFMQGCIEKITPETVIPGRCPVHNRQSATGNTERRKGAVEGC